MTADDMDAAITTVVEGLRPAAHNDWLATAGKVDWTCQYTADHTGGCLLVYAMQLTLQLQTQWVPLFARALEAASGADRLQFLEGAGRILAATVRSASPDARGFHPWGNPDPEGFAGMGCIEALLHGHDLALGLGAAPLDPPRGVCERVLDRMFPGSREAAGDPWLTLQWATGRISLPGRPDVTDWTSHNAPLAE